MRKTNIVYPLFFFIIALAICGQNIWGASIYVLDEAKNATCAREMMESHNHIVPTFNYGLRTDKPPLHYYFMMVSYKMFGVNEFSARFFSAVFGAFTVLITFLYTRRLLDQKTAILAAIVLLTSTHFALQFHLAVPDPYLIFFLTLSVFAFIDGFINQKRSSIYLAYLAIGLGVLAKGPIAIALPGFTVALFIIFGGKFNWKTITGFRPFSGLFLALLIAVPWYAAVGIKTNGEWLRGFFFDHNLERFAEPQEGHGGRYWLTVVFVVAGMLPFSAYVFQSFGNWWKERKNSFLFFCGIYALVVIIFFAIADTKLPNYTVPAYPFLAVLIANYLRKMIDNTPDGTKGFRISSIFILFIMLILPVGLFFGLKADSNFSFLAPKAILLVPVSFLGLVGTFYLYHDRVKPVLYCIGFAFLFFTSVALNVFYPKIDATNPVAQLLPKLDKSKPFAYYQRFNPSFSFYLKKPITSLSTTEDVISFFENHPDGILITRSDFAGEIANLNSLEKVFEKQDLFETKKTVVYKWEEQD